jgi:hypothetical protein
VTVFDALPKECAGVMAGIRSQAYLTGPFGSISVSSQKEIEMSGRWTAGRKSVGQFFGVVGSAVASAQAIEAGRKPSARDARRLGIDPKAFDGMGLR